MIYLFVKPKAVATKRPAVDQKLSGNLVTVVENFRHLQTEGGRNRFLLSAAKDKIFADGHHELENVQLEAYNGKDGQKNLITADSCIYDQSKAQVLFKNNVVVRTADNLIVKTNSLSYDQASEIVKSEERVEFQRDNISGTSIGAVYQEKAGHLALIKDVDITVQPKDANGQAASAPVNIKSNTADYQKAASIIDFIGNVVAMRSSDEMRADNMKGFLDQQNRVTRVEARGNSYLKSSEAGKAFDVKSRDMDLFFDSEQRLQRAVAIGEVFAQSLAEGPKRTIKAETLETIFVAARQTSEISQMKADGRPVVKFGAPAPDARNPNPAERELVADNIKLDYYPGGKDIKTAEATGNAVLTITPTVVDEKAERKTLHAKRFDLIFYDKGNLARTFTATDGVQLDIEPMKPVRPKRTTTSNRLVANFAESQDIVDVTQEGNFKYDEDDKHATADRAIYTEADKVVRLRGSAPTVWDSSARTQAQEIDIHSESDESYGRAKVRTTYYSKETTGGAVPFSNSKSPIFITADEVKVLHKKGVAVYAGNARAWQDENYVKGDRIRLIKQDKQMIAIDNVSSGLYRIEREVGKGRKEVVPVFVTADRMTYNDSERLIHYEGKVVHVRQGTETLEAKNVDVFLQEKGNEIDRMIATDNVVLTQPGRKASGERIEYIAETDEIILTGNLARVEDMQKGTTTGRELTFLRSDDKIFVQDQRGTRRVRSTHRIEREKKS